MRKILLVTAVVGALSMAVTPAGAMRSSDGEEGCQAVNPGQPTCSYTATHPSSSPVAGIAGVGNWVVKVKLGKKVDTFKSPASGEPTAVELNFEEGSKVSVKTLTPGTAVIVGHAD
jgi:uncharacterized low-complexity protein